MAETENSEISNTLLDTISSEPSNTVFIDVDADLIKVEVNNQSTSPLEEYLNIQQPRIRCPECKRYTAETEEKMLRHIRKIHRGENPFQCYMCDYSTYNSVLFEEHVRIHQGIKPYKCSQCPYRSVSKKNTKKHELIHRPDNPHRCEQCGFVARHQRGLRHHALSHGTDIVKECLNCKEQFTSMVAYVRHRKGKKSCPECKKMFCKNLSTHRLEAHGVPKSQQNKKALYKTAIFKCALCDWEGNSKPRILLHLIHHPGQIVDDTVVDTLVLKELGIMGGNKEAVE